MRISDWSSDVCSSDLWTKPENIVVNGAYKLVSWTPKVEATLVKNDKFYDADNVAIDKVIYYAMEERTAMQQRFRAGALDVARDLASEQIDWLRENMAARQIGRASVRERGGQ